MNANQYRFLREFSDLANTNLAQAKELADALLGFVRMDAVTSFSLVGYSEDVAEIVVGTDSLEHYAKDNAITLGKAFDVPVIIQSSWAYRPSVKTVTPTYPFSLKSGDGREWYVELDQIGPNKLRVIKAVRDLTGCGLKEAKDFVEQPTSHARRLFTALTRYEQTDWNDSLKTKAQALTDAGATISV